MQIMLAELHKIRKKKRNKAYRIRVNNYGTERMLRSFFTFLFLIFYSICLIYFLFQWMAFSLETIRVIPRPKIPITANE